MKQLADYKVLKFVKAAAKHSESILAFTDGTYYPNQKKYGSGLVLVHESKDINKCFYGDNSKYVRSGAISGELFAALYAMEYATKLNIKVLILIVDFQGIYDYAGDHYGTKPITKLYRKWVKKYEQTLDIFVLKTNKILAPAKHMLAERLAQDCVLGRISPEIDFPLPWL
jgi:hypothetical protein